MMDRRCGLCGFALSDPNAAQCANWAQCDARADANDRKAAALGKALRAAAFIDAAARNGARW